MSLIHLRQILLSYGPHPLLNRIDLHIDKGERICLIGRNGMGKSTLLKVIMGVVVPDAGVIDRSQGVVIAYLPQTIPDDFSGSVYEVVARGLGDLGNLLIRYEQLNQQMIVSHDDQLMQQWSRVMHEIESKNGWLLGQRVEKILSLMSLPWDVDVSTLSGGMSRRVLLAKALVEEPDLLILDEPTNHLDVEAILWLETFLQNYKKAILFVSHDRAFMQALATRVIELDHGNLSSWSYRYQDFLVHKQASLEALETQQALFDKRLAEEEVWIRQGIKARRTRNEGRVRSLEKMRLERQARQQRLGKVKITSRELQASGKVVFDLEGVSHAYEGTILFKNFSTTIMRGDKIGVLGPNGSGKSTLLKILLGELAPSQGKAVQGTRLEIAYFDQHRAILDENKTVQENVYAGADMITLNGKTRHVLSYLQDFLFSAQRARSLVKTLSGGERNRLLLARLFTMPANVLVMDEPTNDLDIETLELLEERLLNYTGTLLLVSHDRAFLNRVVTSTIVFEGDGKIDEYVGGYDDWQRQVQKIVSAPSIHSIKPAKISETLNKTQALSYKERLELEQLPEKIHEVEAKIDALQKAMISPHFYQQSVEALAQANRNLASVQQALQNLYTRWEILEEKNRH